MVRARGSQRRERLSRGAGEGRWQAAGQAGRQQQSADPGCLKGTCPEQQGDRRDAGTKRTWHRAVPVSATPGTLAPQEGPGPQALPSAGAPEAGQRVPQRWGQWTLGKPRACGQELGGEFEGRTKAL